MKKIVFFVFSSIAVFGITIFFRLGAHKPVQISIEELGEYHLLYKDHTGPYHTINDVIIDVESWATRQNLPCSRTFGEYLDDPRTVDERHLRSLGGCVLDRSYSENLPVELKFKTMPPARYLVARFEGAPSIGPFKVYPKVESYAAEKRITLPTEAIEVYTIKNDREAVTEYLFRISSQ